GCIESDGTESPWIYAEIEATRLLRKNTPKRRKTMDIVSMEGQIIALDEAMSVKYDLNLGHLLLLDQSQIFKLHNCGKTGTNALDFLYDSF
ncbi:TPA: hypothetical protein SLE15_003962, partial [Morganella morganii]|nr:hypothetical protein [Morganella morganii]